MKFKQLKLKLKNVEEEEEVIPNPFIIETEQTDGTKETVKITYSDSTIRHSVLAHETNVFPSQNALWFRWMKS